METQETVRIFNHESAQAEKIFENNYNRSCLGIGLSVSAGSVTAEGRLSESDELHPLSFVDYRSGEITDTASDGIFTVLGSEMLHSIVFTGENAEAYAKYLY